MNNNIRELKKVISVDFEIIENLIVLNNKSNNINQQQTNEVFSEKWQRIDDRKGLNFSEKMQLKWYLKLYGFETEEKLALFLNSKKVIFDAGCGLGYKAAWFARLSPSSLIIGMDYSDAIYRAASNYRNIDNLVFIKGDIGKTNFNRSSIDYINCDQVIHHTENPKKTFKHLSDLLKKSGEFACYVYAKKALPRELLDDYFREFSKKCTKEELWMLSEQLTTLGKNLSELNISFESPDIPLLGIKKGKYDIQRFLYWNFLKCFWNQDLGYETSVETNFDWYAPSNAARYSEHEYKEIIQRNNLKIEYFHSEEACYSGRFKK